MASLMDFVFRNDLHGLGMELARGADPNERDMEGRTPLIQATIDNRLELAQKLLDFGAQVNAQDRLGNSALHYAAQEYRIEIAQLLLKQNGAIADTVDAYGNTPLWRAVFNSRGREKLIQNLLDAGADRNHKNRNGKSPLDLAKTIANFDITQFFP